MRLKYLNDIFLEKFSFKAVRILTVLSSVKKNC